MYPYGPPNNPYSPYPPQHQQEKEGPNILYWVLGIAGVSFVLLVGLFFAVAIFASWKEAKTAARGPVPTSAPAAPGVHHSPGSGVYDDPADDDDDEEEDDDEGFTGPGASHLPPAPPRTIPHHDVKLLSGCSDADLKVVLKGIDDGIATGAPRYNRGDFQGCYQTYVSTSQDIEADLPKSCKGPADALKAGREKAAKLSTSSDKAWAMRDTFDGLIDVIERKGLSL